MIAVFYSIEAGHQNASITGGVVHPKSLALHSLPCRPACSAQSAKWPALSPTTFHKVNGRNFLSHLLIQDLPLDYLIEFPFSVMIEQAGNHHPFISTDVPVFGTSTDNDASYSWRRCQHQSINHVPSLIRFLTASYQPRAFWAGWRTFILFLPLIPVLGLGP